MMRRSIDPRYERVWVNTTPELKKLLKAIAKKRGWSLSLLCHTIFEEWLEQENEELE